MWRSKINPVTRCFFFPSGGYLSTAVIDINGEPNHQKGKQIDQQPRRTLKSGPTSITKDPSSQRFNVSTNDPLSRWEPGTFEPWGTFNGTLLRTCLVDQSCGKQICLHNINTR
jgi:hypothetical protein